MMTLDQFYAKTNGLEFGNPPPQLVPNQGTYQGECVSLVRQLLEVVYAIPTGAWGNAVDYWTNTNPSILAQFDKLPGNTNFKDGDILVWGDDPGTWTNQFGHIAYWYRGQMQSQNYNERLTAGGNNFFTAGYLGTLRYKGDIMNKDQATQLSLYTRLAAGATVDEANTAAAYDIQHMLADPGYAAALAKQIYQGNELFRYKAGHYDADTTALTAQVKDLTAKLALQGQDTQNLNSFGTLLKWFIVRIGLSK